MGPHRLWLLLPLLAVACTGTRVKVSTTSDGGVNIATTVGATGTEGPRRGGYIVVSSPEPRSLNPVTQAAFDVATPLIFEGLVGLDLRGEPVPALAEKWQ